MLETLQDHFVKKIFGKAGGTTHGDVVSIARRERLSQYLPYQFYDPTLKAYTTIEDTVGYIWECTPLYFATNKVLSRLQKFLELPFAEDVVISFHLYADPHIKEIVDSYLSNKIRQEEVLRKAANEYAKFLINGSKGVKALSDLPLRNFRLFISIKQANGLSDDLLSNVEDSLNAAKLNPIRMPGDKLKQILVRFFNNLDNQDVPLQLDPRIPIRKQLIKADTAIHFPEHGYTRIGTKFGACLTHFRVPESTNALDENKLLGGFMGFEDDTNQITSPFLYTTVVTYRGVEEEVSSKAKIVTGQALVGEKARELKRRIEEFKWIKDLPEGVKRARVHQTMWVFDDSTEKLERSVARMNSLASQFDYEYMQETLLAPSLFIASLPLGYYNIKGNAEVIDRYRILPTNTISVLLPVQSDFTGSTRTVCGDVPKQNSPVIITAGRKGQVQGFDVFDPRSNNHNFTISAGSGAGKSVNLNKFVTDYYNSGAILRLVDIGYSFKKNCKINKGRFLDIGEEYLVFNPFYSQSKDSQDLAYDINACATVLSEMVNSGSGKPLEEVQIQLLRNATVHVMSKGNIDYGIDATCDYLNNLKKYAADDPISEVPAVLEMAKVLAYNLTDFKKGGINGQFFNGPSNFNISNDEYVVLELQKLMARKDLFPVIVMQVLNSITQDLYLSDRSSRRFVLFEEAAQYLKEQGHRDLSRLASLIEEGYRRARKHRGSFGAVLQSILDLESFGPVGRVLRSNAAYKIYMFSEDYEIARDKKLIDKDGLAFELINSITNQKPRYSEIFWDTPFGQGAGRLALDPWNFWIATSDGEHYAAYETLISQGMSPAQALSKLSGIAL